MSKLSRWYWQLIYGPK